MVNGLETQLIKVDALQPEPESITRAAQIIKSGGLVAFPTETVYGLGANGLNEEAVKKIFLAKGRPTDNPLILHIADVKDVFYLADHVPLKAQVLMEAFWPGPLTLVLPCRKVIPLAVTAGLDTVAIRMPSHPVALALIRAAKLPVAAPSANRSGYPSPTAAEHVLEDLAGRIDAVLDGGLTGIGLESTVLDMSQSTPMILRPGGITHEQLEGAIGHVIVDPGLESSQHTPKAPGMKYRHYAPRAEVIVLLGEPQKIAEKAEELIRANAAAGIKTGLLVSAETWPLLIKEKSAYIREMGSRQDVSTAAKKLYHELRSCDQNGCGVVLVEGYKEQGLGAALMNRLLKSAGGRQIIC